MALPAFQGPILTRSLGQLAVSLGGFAGVCAIMYATVSVSYWLTSGLSVLATGLLVRIFIIQHDCGHGSFPGPRANDVVGILCSLLTLTPYAAWRRQHAGHHRVWNDLDRRRSGVDIYSACLTVAEFQALTAWSRRWYRWTRHPVVSNVLLPPLIFVVLYRLPFDTPRAWKPERRAVHATNLGLAALIAVLGRARHARSAADRDRGVDRRRLAVCPAASLRAVSLGEAQ
jgi:omega-6 fatty acid desaturase (delta-12 desaturase)